MSRALDTALWLCAAWFLGVLGYAVAVRVGYPFELEWMEGTMHYLVDRVREGSGLYVEPTLEHTMPIYAPLYYWIAGFVADLVGSTPLGARIVSVAALLATLALIAVWVRREGGRWVHGAAAAALYAATFAPGEAYHDSARVDSLFVALFFGAAYGVRFWRGAWGAARVGLLLGIATWTKQTALPAAIPFALVWALRGWRPRSWGGADSVDAATGQERAWANAALLFGVAALVIVGGFLTLDAATGGWADYFLLGQVAHHEVETNMFWGFWSRDIGRVLPLGCIAGALAAWWLWRARDLRAALPFCMALVVLGGASYASRLHKGGGINVTYPAYAVLALALGVACARAPTAMLRGAASLLIVVQTVGLAYFYDPFALVPTPADYRAGEALRARIEQLPAPALTPYHAHLGHRAGQAAGGHPVNINDVFRSADLGVKAAYTIHVENALARHRFGSILLDRAMTDPTLDDAIRAHYEVVEELAPEEHGYRWMTAPRVPIQILLPKK